MFEYIYDQNFAVKHPTTTLVNAIRFRVGAQTTTHELYFAQLLTIAQAIRRAEEWLAQPFTEQEFNQLKEQHDVWTTNMQFYQLMGNQRASLAGGTIFIKRITVENLGADQQMVVLHN